MRRVAEDVYLLRGTPRHLMNVYLVQDVLIDAATRFGARRILKQLRGHGVRAHALTHGHPDHQGSSRRVCREFEAPLWCGELDADAVEAGDVLAVSRGTLRARLFGALCAGPGHPVERRLREGDEVAGFSVLHVPGHSPGHLAYWRESDRVLLLGDTLTNIGLLTLRPGLHEAPAFATPDPAATRDAARRLARLEPAVVCFGHGPPLFDTRRFVEFVSQLPA